MATALVPTTTGVLLKEATPNLEAKTLIVTLPATVDDGDTFTIDLADYGGSTLLAHLGYIHTTADSVLVQEQGTTAVSGTELTITVGGSTDNKKRTYVIWYY